MKKIVVVLFFSLLFPYSAVANSKIINTKCAIVNKIKTVSGKKYICSKENKKLVWVKHTEPKTYPSYPCTCPICCAKTAPSSSSTLSPSPSTVLTQASPVFPTTLSPSPSVSPLPVKVDTVKDISYVYPTDPSSKIDFCKIRENNSNRSGMLNTLASGFPSVNSLTPKFGKVKWALIPIDFQDLQGQSNFRSRVDEQMKLLSEWVDTVSEGKFSVEWVVLDKWVRLPGSSSDYKIANSDNIDRAPNGVKLWNTAMTQSDIYFDYSNIQTVNFLLPEGQTFVSETSQGFPWDEAVKNFNTKEGKVSSFSMPGAFMDQPGREYWSYWAHEFGHAIGIPHVGSSREFNTFQVYDLMGSQDGPSRELSGWLRFVAGWLDNDRVYCQEIAKLTSNEITLVPLSSSDPGLKMVVIPVSETKALILESRRVTKFDCSTPTKRNGVLVYTYDARLSHGQAFLAPVYPSDRKLEGGICNGSTRTTSQAPNVLLRKNDKVTIDGITIEVIDHAKYDKIKIVKN